MPDPETAAVLRLRSQENALPAISGKQLIKLLKRDGWAVGRHTRHGFSLWKRQPDGRNRVTIIPDKRSALPPGTLSDILGPQQTNIGRNGLAHLIERYGLS